jgi:hypothetical protein
MPTQKILEIDLTQLTSDSIQQLADIQEEIIADLEKQGKRPSKRKQNTTNEFQKSDESMETRIEELQKTVEYDSVKSKSRHQDFLAKAFGGKVSFDTLVSMGLNPLGSLGRFMGMGIPGFGAAVAATATITQILKKFDDLEKKFTNQVRTLTRADRDNEFQARVQAGISQEITSYGPGFYDPRDVYNTFNEFNGNQRRIETDYAIRNTSGVE